MEKFFKYLNKHNSSLNSAEESEFSELKEIWDIAGERNEIPIPNRKEQWQQLQDKLDDSPPKVKTFLLSFWVGIAASFLLIVGSGAVYFTMFYNHTYRTTDNVQQIVLSDGSEIELNKHSELIVRPGFNRNSRKLELKGEAYFKVSKAEHPFIITSEAAKVKVVGTAFNLKARNRMAELAVNEGIVDFSGMDANKKVRVIEGQLSKCYANSNPEQPKALQFTDYPGWLHGQVHFQDNTLLDVCNELEVNMGIQIEILEDSLNKRRISGSLGNNNPEEVITILCSLIQCEYKFQNGKYVIY